MEMAANFMSFSPRIDASDGTVQIQFIAVGNDFTLSDSLPQTSGSTQNHTALGSLA